MKCILPIFFLILSCNRKKQPELHRYVILIERQELSLLGDNYEPGTKTDSVMCENDSIAYHKGVIAYTGNLRAENLLKANKKLVASYAKSFKVVNEAGQDVKEYLSSKYIVQMEKFINDNSK